MSVLSVCVFVLPVCVCVLSVCGCGCVVGVCGCVCCGCGCVCVVGGGGGCVWWVGGVAEVCGLASDRRVHCVIAVLVVLADVALGACSGPLSTRSVNRR